MKKRGVKHNVDLLFHHCREKLKVITDDEVWKYLTINGITYPFGKSRLRLYTKDKLKLQYMLRKLLDTEKPKIYPGRRRKAPVPEAVKQKWTKKWTEITLDQLKIRLIDAINAEEYCVDLMKEYLALLPSPVDF